MQRGRDNFPEPNGTGQVVSRNIYLMQLHVRFSCAVGANTSSLFSVVKLVNNTSDGGPRTTGRDWSGFFRTRNRPRGTGVVAPQDRRRFSILLEHNPTDPPRGQSLRLQSRRPRSNRTGHTATGTGSRREVGANFESQNCSPTVRRPGFEFDSGIVVALADSLISLFLPSTVHHNGARPRTEYLERRVPT